MSQRQTLQAVQAPPDITRVLLDTVERYIEENVNRKLKVLTEQIMQIRDEQRALRHSLVDEFINSVVRALTEERIRSAFADALSELEGSLRAGIEKAGRTAELLGEDLRQLAEEVRSLSQRVSQVERVLSEAPPAQRVQIDLSPAEKRIEELRREVEELEGRVGRVSEMVASLEGTVRRALEGFSALVEELERSVAEREPEEEEV